MPRRIADKRRVESSESKQPFCERQRASWRLLVALCVFGAMLSRLVYLIRPFDSDGAMFIYMGRVISEGGRFCHDICDNKFPSVGLMTSICWRAFGANWPAYVLLGFCMSAITIATLARAAFRHFGRDAGWATLLFAIVYLNFNFAVFGGFQLETPQGMFASLAAAAALDAIAKEDSRDAFLVGLASGCAMLLKPTGLAAACAFATAVLCCSRSWKSVFKLGFSSMCGLLIPLSVALIYLIGADNLRDIPALWKQISRYAASSSWEAADLMKPMVIIVLLGLPMLVRGWVFRRDRIDSAFESAVSPAFSRSEREQKRSRKPVLAFLAAWLVVETLGVVAQRRMYAYHFLVMGPPAAMLFGAIPRRLRVASMSAALVPVSLFSIYGASLVIEHGYRGQRTLEVSDYLNVHAQPGDAAWQDDATRLLIETGLKGGSRYPLTFLFANYDVAPLEYSDQILRDFEQNQTKYVVLRADLHQYVDHQCQSILELERFPKRQQNFRQAWGHIAQYVHANYTVEATIGREQIWKRRDRAGDEASVPRD